MSSAHSVSDHIAGLTDVLVLLAPGLGRSARRELPLPPGAEVRELTAPAKPPRPRELVLLAARDLVDLRRAATGLTNVGAAARVGVWLEREATVLPSVLSRLGRPPVDELVACREGHSHVLVRFSSPVQARQVLLDLARSVVGPRSPGAAWPLLGARRDEPWLWPPADPAATVAMPSNLYDTAVDYPPDLVLTHEPGSATADFSTLRHPVLGRTPAVGAVDAPLSWQELAALGAEEAVAAMTERGPLSLGPVDDRVLNPMGFEKSSTGRAARLEAGRGACLRVSGAPSTDKVEIDAHWGLSETDVPLLRRLPGLELTWKGGPGPQHYCRLVVELAMAGVPLTSRETPFWASLLLPGGLVAALEAPVDLADRLSREEHSIRLRRAALRSHALDAWRRAVARTHGLQASPSPRVSVLLVTRRPEMLPFALRQVARQRDADFEVVLATHGFEADQDAVASFRADCSAPLTVFAADGDLRFGAVLNAAAQRAQGDLLLKMDDDDWYGPNFISDLLLARGYSGADVVGCPPEFTFIEPMWLTTRRPDATESYRPVVAGGTMLIDRATFRALGGFRDTRKYVDANLLSAVINGGGAVYRTHGLGYVLRRGADGHTWDPGLGYFVTQRRAPEQWRGFRPSALLEPAPVDLPAKAGDERVSP